MKIDVKDLLYSVPQLQSQTTRIGLPDDPSPVRIPDPKSFINTLNMALSAFRNLRSGPCWLVNVEVYSNHRSMWIRFVQTGPCVERKGQVVQTGPCVERKGQVEPTLEAAFQAFRGVAQENGGDLHYWGGNNYFDVSLPFQGPMRDGLPDVKHLPWDARYRYYLEQASWDWLRQMVYRFSNLAESFALRCVELQMKRVLIPSVGLCVHPWLFADHGLSVIATDVANSALAALAEPGRWPQVFSRSASQRWDISEAASHADPNYLGRFTRMPVLEDQGVRDSLRQRTTFAQCDWACLPLETGSVDALFATNALPRESSADQMRVLQEWVRVLRSGGMAFIAQHNFYDSEIETILEKAGWMKGNILRTVLEEASWKTVVDHRGGTTSEQNTTVFQVYHSSG